MSDKLKPAPASVRETLRKAANLIAGQFEHQVTPPEVESVLIGLHAIAASEQPAPATGGDLDVEAAYQAWLNQRGLTASDKKRAFFLGQTKWLWDFLAARSAAQGTQAKSTRCRACSGNDGDMPCAYPSEGIAGCLRDKRLASNAGAAPAGATKQPHEHVWGQPFWSSVHSGIDRQCETCSSYERG